MPRKIAIIQGHPDPAGGHLCHALVDAYAESAVSGGHSVSRIDVAHLDFPLLRTEADFEKAPTPESLKDASDLIAAADHIVIVFPLWMGTMPALLKGFLEQVMRPGFVSANREKRGPKKLMTGRSARIVVTMGMPALAYRFYFFAHGVSNLRRNILKFVGFKPVRTTYFGMVGNVDPAKTERWLNQMRALGAKGK
jgi:putative NADPH-quinone reductase